MKKTFLKKTALCCELCRYGEFITRVVQYIMSTYGVMLDYVILYIPPQHNFADTSSFIPQQSGPEYLIIYIECIILTDSHESDDVIIQLLREVPCIVVWIAGSV